MFVGFSKIKEGGGGALKIFKIYYGDFKNAYIIQISLCMCICMYIVYALILRKKVDVA